MGQVTAKVTLVSSTVDAEARVAAAGKLCYASDTDNILEQDKDDAEKFIDRVIGMGHMSVIEHANFTFLIEGVSRAMTHQLVRHRVASYSQRSQRYVSHQNFDYVVPPQFEGKTVEVDGQAQDAQQFYRDTMELIGKRYGILQRALGAKGEKSNEDARYVLPNACETKIFVTMNARELWHFLEERLCQRAQWEIRGVAEQMLQQLRQACPAIFNPVGPKCIRQHGCPEGKLTCGKYQEMKQRYGSR
ncbi:MAG: FAD-dependent thymidylate synthase [Sedimentisphaerales bacterium]|nr:FAD-dependent thymidylate synthase [Sedimentisphaerales bacterium]